MEYGKQLQRGINPQRGPHPREGGRFGCLALNRATGEGAAEKEILQMCYFEESSPLIQ